MELNYGRIDSNNYISGLGIVTNEKLIIDRGLSHDIIDLQRIRKVNLIKKRIFIYNILFFSISFLTTLVFLANIDKHLYLKSLIFMVGITATFFAIFYKMHQYILVIRLENQEIMTVRTGQKNKAKIKKFYYSILKIISTREVSIKEKSA